VEEKKATSIQDLLAKNRAHGNVGEFFAAHNGDTPMRTPD
jgi:hypothetical protein